MRALAGRIAAAGLILTGAAAVVRAATAPIVNEERMDSTRQSAAPPHPAAGDPAPDTLVALAARRPLFRPARRPAAVRFDPARQEQAASPPSAPPVERPALALSGILWGAEPAAILEGLPGTEGSTVVRRGEVVGGIRVTRIEQGRVVLVGRDTTWRLEVRDPWR
jgi:hypothetical protein